MHVKIEKVAAWSGVGMLLAFLVMFWFIAGVIPPIDPSDTAAEVAARYSEDGLRIRIGLALMIFFAFAWAPFWALLARQVRRIEGYWGVMSLTQILLGVTFPFGFSLCAIFAVTAAYRPERNPDVTQALNDVFWFVFVGLVGPLITQVVIIAFAVLFVDKRAVPSFPRWFGYFNIWYAVLGVPGCAIYLFKTGPLAWNGIFAFWIPLTVFCIWQVVASVMLAKAVDIEAAERDVAVAERTWEPAA
jgi:MFS family permease